MPFQVREQSLATKSCRLVQPVGLVGADDATAVGAPVGTSAAGSACKTPARAPVPIKAR
jgi:hypothetical protein